MIILSLENCSCLSRNKNKMYKCATQGCTIEKLKVDYQKNINGDYKN